MPMQIARLYDFGDIRLEEIESSRVDGTDVWLITLSSYMPDHRGPLAPVSVWNAIGAEREREYKVFTVAKDTGEVLSMKIRLLAAPSAT